MSPESQPGPDFAAAATLSRITSVSDLGNGGCGNAIGRPAVEDRHAHARRFSREITSRPPASMIRVEGPTSRRTAVVLPTAVKRPSLTAKASAAGRPASDVKTLPLIRMRSGAAWTGAATASAFNSAAAIRCISTSRKRQDPASSSRTPVSHEQPPRSIETAYWANEAPTASSSRTAVAHLSSPAYECPVRGGHF